MTRALDSIGLAVGLVALLAACDSGAIPGGAKKDGPAPIGDMAMLSSADSAGRAENDEGIGHYKEKRWNEAKQHFRRAVEADGKLAEAHYNLGLTLDKLGDHDGATDSFKKVTELSPIRSPMRESVILKEHVGQ